MSYFLNLDEMTEESLIGEILRRAKDRQAGRCDYCHQKQGVVPGCKFPERHSAMKATDPNHLSLAAKVLAEGVGADAAVLVTLHPVNESWEAHHSAYVKSGVGITWEIVGDVLRDAAEELESEEHIFEEPETQ